MRTQARITSGVVVLRGLLRMGTSTTIATLPSGYRPVRRRLFIALCSKGACRVNLDIYGRITIYGRTPGCSRSFQYLMPLLTLLATAWPAWISLSGLTFDPTPDAATKRDAALEREDLSVYDSAGEDFPLDDTHRTPSALYRKILHLTCRSGGGGGGCCRAGPLSDRVL